MSDYHSESILSSKLTLNINQVDAVSFVDGAQIRVQEGAHDRDRASDPTHQGDFRSEEDDRRHNDDHSLQGVADGMRNRQNTPKRHECSLVVQVVRNTTEHCVPDEVRRGVRLQCGRANAHYLQRILQEEANGREHQKRHDREHGVQIRFG